MAESWQVGLCKDPISVEDVDGCAGNPARRAWAEARCSVIETKFGNCSVNSKPFYERCIYDTCACDTGGECECFCTAVAAYAHECNKRGFHPYWRTQDMCPIQCDGYRIYNPCVSACPITCDNYNSRAKVGVLLRVDRNLVLSIQTSSSHIDDPVNQSRQAQVYRSRNRLRAKSLPSTSIKSNVSFSCDSCTDGQTKIFMFLFSNSLIVKWSGN